MGKRKKTRVLEDLNQSSSSTWKSLYEVFYVITSHISVFLINSSSERPQVQLHIIISLTELPRAHILYRMASGPIIS
ncbi:hypothetical protein CsSME_00045606 [Camellia sinensis var. sinensis]